MLDRTQWAVKELPGYRAVDRQHVVCDSNDSQVQIRHGRRRQSLMYRHPIPLVVSSRHNSNSLIPNARIENDIPTRLSRQEMSYDPVIPPSLCRQLECPAAPARLRSPRGLPGVSANLPDRTEEPEPRDLSVLRIRAVRRARRDRFDEPRTEVRRRRLRTPAHHPAARAGGWREPRRARARSRPPTPSTPACPRPAAAA